MVQSLGLWRGHPALSIPLRSFCNFLRHIELVLITWGGRAQGREVRIESASMSFRHLPLVRSETQLSAVGCRQTLTARTSSIAEKLNLMAILITPDDYLPEMQGDISLGSKEDAHFQHTADNLAARKRNEYTPISDVNDLTGTPTLDLEVELQQVQYELHHTTNALKQIQLEKKAFELASQIVDQQAEEEGSKMTELEQHSAVDQLLSQYGQTEVEGTLQWASEGLSQELAEAANEALETDGEDAIQVFNAVKQIKELPAEAVYRGEVEGQAAWDVSLVNRLADQYGEQGDQLATINAAMCNGTCSRRDAAKLVMSDPRLMIAAMDAARKGLISLAL